MPSFGVIFDFCPAPALAWQRPSSPVNDTGGMAGTVWLLSVCERLLIVWRLICSNHAGCWLCGCVGVMSLMSLCAFWLGCTFGNVCGLPVGFGAVVGVFWPLPPIEY